MQKILKLSGVSVVAILTAINANAAGYTCEELIQYTSCNPGYYLGNCPDGYTYGVSWCYDDVELSPDWECNDEYCSSEEDRRYSCNESGPFYGVGCFRNDVIEDLNENWDQSPYYQLELEELPDGAFISASDGANCGECPAGSYCVGGDATTAVATPCVAGTYQPNTKQTSCIDAPVGNYVAGTGATSYTACAMGSYQPTAGQESCLTCPAGSYCAGTGLTQPSGKCNIGSYSGGGATTANCTACPATDLTDKDGATVVATTATTGSTSFSACYVGEEYYFTDTKGTYHYKSDCTVKPWQLTEITEEMCEQFAAMETVEDTNWNWTSYNSCIGVDDNSPGYASETTSLFDGITEEECIALCPSGGDCFMQTYWKDNQCHCSGGIWEFYGDEGRWDCGG